MIRRIHLTNFKCFDRLALEAGPLNVLAGSNGTGKSTFVQALLILFQSAQSGALARGSLQLNGRLTELGTTRDVLYRRSDTDQLQIGVEDDEGEFLVSATVSSAEPEHSVAVHTEGRNIGRLSHGELFYLSAERLAPQKSYPMNTDGSPSRDVGARGEFAPLLYNRSRLAHIDNEALLLDNQDGMRFSDVETQFTLWMNRLFPGFQVRTDRLNQMDAVILGLSLQNQIGEPDFSRPPNVGFGVSYILPVILAGLLATRDVTLIVENPEAHLHPSAQSLIGEFLVRVAAGGAQVFVETHSDHVVNGIRIACRNDVISTHAIHFLAFQRTPEYGSHVVSRVALDESGGFVRPPELFFDQMDKDLKLIYGF